MGLRNIFPSSFLKDVGVSETETDVLNLADLVQSDFFFDVLSTK